VVDSWYTSDEQEFMKGMSHMFIYVTEDTETLSKMGTMLKKRLINYIIDDLKGHKFAANTGYKKNIWYVSDLRKLRDILETCDTGKSEKLAKLILLTSEVYKIADAKETDDLYNLFINIWHATEKLKETHQVEEDTYMHMFIFTLTLFKSHAFTNPDMWFKLTTNFYNKKQITIEEYKNTKELFGNLDNCKKLIPKGSGTVLMKRIGNTVERNAFEFFDPEYRKRRKQSQTPIKIKDNTGTENKDPAKKHTYKDRQSRPKDSGKFGEKDKASSAQKQVQNQ